MLLLYLNFKTMSIYIFEIFNSNFLNFLNYTDYCENKICHIAWIRKRKKLGDIFLSLNILYKSINYIFKININIKLYMKYTHTVS